MGTYIHVPSCLPHVKLQNVACTHTVTNNFGMRTWISELVQHTRNACHKLTLRRFATLCVWCTGIVAIGNDMHLFCIKSVSLYVVIMMIYVYECVHINKYMKM